MDADAVEIRVLGCLIEKQRTTPGELKQRSERLHAFESTAHVEQRLEQLAERELVARLERRPGQKEERWAQLLGADAEAAAPLALRDSGAATLEERVAALERHVAELKAAVAERD